MIGYRLPSVLTPASPWLGCDCLGNIECTSDEALHYWGQRAVLLRQELDGPGAGRQVKRQYLKWKAVRVEINDRMRERRYVPAACEQLAVPPVFSKPNFIRP